MVSDQGFAQGLNGRHASADTGFKCQIHAPAGSRCKQFIAGSGQPIVGPADLAAYRPTVVVAMNDIYFDEIAADLRSRGIEAELIHA